MKAPIVHYEDIAAPAGLTGVNVSGPEHSKRYIIEPPEMVWPFLITTTTAA
jgi:hypothetical protein